MPRIIPRGGGNGDSVASARSAYESASSAYNNWVGRVNSDQATYNAALSKLNSYNATIQQQYANIQKYKAILKKSSLDSRARHNLNTAQASFDKAVAAKNAAKKPLWNAGNALTNSKRARDRALATKTAAYSRLQAAIKAANKPAAKPVTKPVATPKPSVTKPVSKPIATKPAPSKPVTKPVATPKPSSHAVTSIKQGAGTAAKVVAVVTTATVLATAAAGLIFNPFKAASNTQQSSKPSKAVAAQPSDKCGENTKNDKHCATPAKGGTSTNSGAKNNSKNGTAVNTNLVNRVYNAPAMNGATFKLTFKDPKTKKTLNCQVEMVTAKSMKDNGKGMLTLSGYAYLKPAKLTPACKKSGILARIHSSNVLISTTKTKGKTSLSSTTGTKLPKGWYTEKVKGIKSKGHMFYLNTFAYEPRRYAPVTTRQSIPNLNLRYKNKRFMNDSVAVMRVTFKAGKGKSAVKTFKVSTRAKGAKAFSKPITVKAKSVKAHSLMEGLAVAKKPAGSQGNSNTGSNKPTAKDPTKPVKGKCGTGYELDGEKCSPAVVADPEITPGDEGIDSEDTVEVDPVDDESIEIIDYCPNGDTDPGLQVKGTECNGPAYS